MPHDPEPESQLDDRVADLLAHQDTWEPAPADGLDRLLAAIGEQADTTEDLHSPDIDLTHEEHESNADVIDLASRRAAWAVPFAAGVAAALAVLALIAGGFALAGRDSGQTTELAQSSILELSGTDLAPNDVVASVELTETPLGTRINLDVANLAPAEPGTFYEAWLLGDTGAVSAGTFHLRGGDGDIELWAGVTTEDFPGFGITIQDVGDTTPSSLVVLTGEMS